MSEMVERVREAILSVPAITPQLTWAEKCELFARAAIAAMREPTDAMISGAHRGYMPGEPVRTRDAWANMIDEALREPASGIEAVGEDA